QLGQDSSRDLGARGTRTATSVRFPRQEVERWCAPQGCQIYRLGYARGAARRYRAGTALDSSPENHRPEESNNLKAAGGNQVDDLLDGFVGAVVGGFEFAGKDFRLADEVRYIQRHAANHHGRIVSIGQLVLFSTETGDAWLLDPADRLAARLAR